MAKGRRSGSNLVAGAMQARIEALEATVAGGQLERVKNELEQPAVQNSLLGEAFGFNSGGFPGNQGSPWTPAISSSETIFKNLRWYLVSNFRQMLSEAFVELGLIQTIVKIPVEDALRGGIEIKSEELSPEDVQELQISVDRDDDLNTIGEAAEWMRLFGGGGILVLTDQDPEEELRLEDIDEKTPLEFRAVDMWEITWDMQGSEGYDPTTQNSESEFYNYYGEPVHNSRVMKLKGITPPSFIRPRLRGWGFSVVETLVRSINQYLKSNDLGFEVLDEFKLDVYKIKNLVNSLLSPQGKDKVRERIALANWQKNYQNAIVMDAEDDYDHKQLSFAGLADAMKEIRMQVASDMRMPLSKLFGISATGFNSGEDDIEVYNSMVEGNVRNKIKYPILRVLEIKCQKLFGFVPEDLTIEFKPLRYMSSEQEETVRTQKWTRIKDAATMGLISVKEARDASNKGKLFDIKLVGDAPEGDLAVAAEGNNEDGTDTDDPGTERADSRSPKATEKGGAAKGGKEPPKAEPTKSTKSEPVTQKAKNGRISAQAIRLANAWDEDKHPRGDDGKFGTVHHSTYEDFEAKDIKPSKGGYFGGGFYVHADKDATTQYGDKTHSYKLSGKPIMDLSGDKLKPDAVKVFKEMGLDTERIQKPSQTMKPLQIAISEIRKKFGDEAIGSGAMEKLRSFLKEKGYIGIQFSHNDTDENMVIFDKKDLSAVKGDPERAHDTTETIDVGEDGVADLTEEQEATARARFSEAARGPQGKNPATETPKETSERQHKREKEMRDRAKPMTTISEKGQIKIKAPKSIDEAKQLVTEMTAHFEKAMATIDKTPESKMRAAHASRQLDRAIGMCKKVLEIKTSNAIPQQAVLANAVKRYSRTQRAYRLVVLNSAQFDKASYEADGGDSWIDPRRAPLFDDPPGVDKMLWARAKSASRDALGEVRWQFVAWWYRKQGGSFSQVAAS